MDARTRFRVAIRAIAAALLLAAVVSVPAAAQSVAVRYERLTQREKAARASTSVAVATLRSLAKSYESFTRAHYLSGYADNALWQAAGLYETAYARTKDARDHAQAIRLLTWLKKEYPTGALAKQAEVKLRASPSEPKTVVVAATPVAPAGAPTAPIAAVPPPPVAAPIAPPRTEPAPAVKAPASTEHVGRAGAEPAVASVPLAPPKPPPAAPMLAISVKDVTYTALPKGDRLVLEFSAEAQYSSSRTSPPDRVYIDLPNASALPALAERATKISGTLVKSVSFVRAANGSVRIVLQLNGQPRYSTFPLYDPFRLVIDVESDAAPSTLAPRSPAPTVLTKSVARDAIALASAPAPIDASTPDATVQRVAATPSATRAGDYSLARQLGLGVSRVVIDPGHGGHDPGASANGVTEAGLVLDVALRLEGILSERDGMDVVLTRRTDDYVSLEQRTAIANREAADMFISIHANSSPQKGTSGIETFFLDFASNPHAGAVAARENATSAQNMRVLPELVKTIALTNKLQESRELAGVVQSSLVKRLRMQDSGAKDLGVKRAPFVVLIGAQMPSVLAEVSFLTNRAEASLLKQTAYRQRIAQALADAILKYQGTLKKVTTVTARNDR